MNRLRHILLLAVGLALTQAKAQVPPLPPVKQKTLTATQGSGAGALLSVKAAAIPTPVLMRVSWVPTNLVWTQMVYPSLVITGSVKAWATNFLTNWFEVQECSDGVWSVRATTNRPPVTFPRSNGRVQILRLRSYWQ